MPDTFLQSLSCPLPEDIAHLKGAGEYELALRLIDRRLAGHRSAIKNIFMECHISDSYSNTCVISRIHLLFSLLLRRYYESIEFYASWLESLVASM